jgi:hypothetical protein
LNAVSIASGRAHERSHPKDSLCLAPVRQHHGDTHLRHEDGIAVAIAIAIAVAVEARMDEP